MGNKLTPTVLELATGTRTMQLEQHNYGFRIVDVDAGSAERLRIDAAGILSAGATELKSAGGYVKLPSGIYFQWKTAVANTSGVTTSWPITFPNAVWGAWAINNNQPNPPAPTVNSLTTSNFKLTVSAGGPTCYVLGVGY